MTYADLWRDAINEIYTDTYAYDIPVEDGEDEDAAVLRILTRAADCLRAGATHSFSGAELDVVRHLMPAHEVHQSAAQRWVLENYGDDEGAA